MHLKTGVPKIIFVILSLSVLLSSCGGKTRPEQQVLSVRERYEEMKSVTAKASITADYGERIYSYEVDLSGNASAGSLMVETPENIAGTVLRWSDGETRLDYDDISLETGPLTAGGLSPADAVPAILTAITSGELKECSLSREGELSAEFQSLRESSVTVICLFDKEQVLQKAELSENGRVVLTITFSHWNQT